jgi:hypothetical protein
VGSPGLFPETQQGFGGPPQRICPAVFGCVRGPGNLQRNHQEVVVMLAEWMQTGVTLQVGFLRQYNRIASQCRKMAGTTGVAPAI